MPRKLRPKLLLQPKVLLLKAPPQHHLSHRLDWAVMSAEDARALAKSPEPAATDLDGISTTRLRTPSTTMQVLHRTGVTLSIDHGTSMDSLLGMAPLVRSVLACIQLACMQHGDSNFAAS